MTRYAMVTDLRRCVGCQACTAACNAEWDVPAGYARTRIQHTPAQGTFPNLAAGILVAQCAQCDEAPCVPACPSGATYRDANGVVRVNREVCIGCGYCVAACPYDARYIHPVFKKADKCDFCAPRVARGQEPACVATCPTQAKVFGDLEDREGPVFKLVYDQGAQRRETPAIQVGPNVYYQGKPQQVALVMDAFPPRPPQMPVSGSLWEKVAKPVVLGAVGLTFAGQAIAFFHQLWNGEEDYED
jgi:Fe-S-cluster-containing dehydrogenase component